MVFRYFGAYSHEAVDGRQKVPRTQQEEGEGHHHQETAQIHEGVLGHEPPETQPIRVDGDKLTLHGHTHTHMHTGMIFLVDPRIPCEGVGQHLVASWSPK